jgi:proteic killer suppression protein
MAYTFSRDPILQIKAARRTLGHKMSSKIDKQMHERILRRLDRLDVAAKPEDMNLPGFDFHKLRGKPVRYTVHVNGPWAVTFEFEDGDALRVDFEQYH